jgi:hypothetical protein
LFLKTFLFSFSSQLVFSAGGGGMDSVHFFYALGFSGTLFFFSSLSFGMISFLFTIFFLQRRYVSMNLKGKSILVPEPLAMLVFPMERLC